MISNEIMDFGLVEIEKLQQFLGFKDLRAVKGWCLNNGIKILVCGKNKYVIQDELQSHLNLQYKSLCNSENRTINSNNDLIDELAGNNVKLAGNNSKENSKRHSFAPIESPEKTSLKDLVSKYKSEIR